MRIKYFYCNTKTTLFNTVIRATNLPVLRLVYTLGISFREFGLAVEGRYGRGELRHGMQLAGHVIQHGHDMSWELGPD